MHVTSETGDYVHMHAIPDTFQGFNPCGHICSFAPFNHVACLHKHTEHKMTREQTGFTFTAVLDETETK